jgi:predicted PurR-regulated permease PerM
MNPLNNPEFIIKLFMIGILLFVVHSVIFKYYINDLLKDNFSEGIRQMVDTGLKNKITNVKTNPVIKTLIDLFPSEIKEAYSDENKDVLYYNKNFVFNLVSINIILIIVLFIFIYIYKDTCNKNINLLNSFITIIIVLAFIGYFEYTFFNFKK